MRKKALLEKLAAQESRQRELQKKLELAATDETVEMSAIRQSTAELHTLDDEIAATRADLATIEDAENLARRNAGASASTGAGRSAQVHNRAEDRPWESFGEFLQSVALAGMPGSTVDPRLHQELAASGSAAGVPSDGGFLVRPEYAELIYNQAFGASTLASRCRSTTLTTGNRLVIPHVSETSRATGSRYGGVRVYRTDEAATVAATKPQIDKLEITPEKLMGLWYATDELLSDAGAMQQLATEAFSEEFAWVLDDEIINGNGAGRCLGILKSPSLITVAKESGQAANSLVYENIVKMWNRLPIRSRANAVWLINQDVEPQLQTMTQQVSTVSAWPVFLPPGGASSDPFSRLYGRPILPIEQAETLGTVGDIILADLSQYRLVDKGALKAANSMHVRFLYDEMAFRWTSRISGQPQWKSAITAAKGSLTLSPFVALATRA